MRISVKKSLLTIAVSSVLASPVVNATNGYFSHGYSTKEKGLAGAGVAFSQDAMAAATNPAGMAFVGARMDIGAALFSPSRSYTVTGAPPMPAGSTVVTATGVCNTPPPPHSPPCTPPFSLLPGSVDSGNDFFLIPHFAYNWQLAEDATVGVSIYGNGGMNTEYKTGGARVPAPTRNGFELNLEDLPGTYGAGTTGVNLEQLFINISYAKKFNDKHALGGSLIVAGQRFSAQGLENFQGFSLDKDNLSGDRSSTAFGMGIKLGYQGEVSDGVRVGVSYQSKISMSEFDEYKGLFAEGGDFDIPSSYSIGVAFDVGTSGVIVADIQQINYSDVAAISNPVSRLTDGSCTDALNASLGAGAPMPASGAGCLGGANGAGFGWDDMTIIKIGYQVDVGDNTWRVGFSHAEQPVPESETMFNILAPAVIENHVTAGLTMRLPGNQEFNIAAMFAPSNSVKGPNPFDGGATQIEIEMSQWEVQAGWAWKY